MAPGIYRPESDIRSSITEPAALAVICLTAAFVAAVDRQVGLLVACTAKSLAMLPGSPVLS